MDGVYPSTSGDSSDGTSSTTAAAGTTIGTTAGSTTRTTVVTTTVKTTVTTAGTTTVTTIGTTAASTGGTGGDGSGEVVLITDEDGNVYVDPDCQDGSKLPCDHLGVEGLVYNVTSKQCECLGGYVIFGDRCMAVESDGTTSLENVESTEYPKFDTRTADGSDPSGTTDGTSSGSSDGSSGGTSSAPGDPSGWTTEPGFTDDLIENNWDTGYGGSAPTGEIYEYPSGSYEG